jgi:hypothetical protein
LYVTLGFCQEYFILYLNVTKAEMPPKAGHDATDLQRQEIGRPKRLSPSLRFGPRGTPLPRDSSLAVARLVETAQPLLDIRPPCPAFWGVAPRCGWLCQPLQEASIRMPGHENGLVG